MSESSEGSSRAGRVEELLALYISACAGGGPAPDLAALCGDRPELLPALRRLVDRYLELERDLAAAPDPDPVAAPEPLPSFPGLRVIERLGRGGGGEVFKVEDATLGRVVAAKVLRRGSPLAATAEDFLREARTLALFEDPRIVKVLEFRPGDPPLLLLEYVDGFDLTAIGPSLEYRQRARVVAQVAEALERAHRLGLQHRDLKPSHILVGADLAPKILDFGLSRGEPDRGHGVGTLAYMAPEQLDRRAPIDARTDVYGLGVVLYELLCGERPFRAGDDTTLAAEILAGVPRLPVEVVPDVPEPLQAVALQAMDREPAERYASAQDMARDLRRFLDGRPVEARPRQYQPALAQRLAPHLDDLQEWERMRLIYPHEAEQLRAAYRRLEAREDDWIVQSRKLSLSQIALYLGAFVLAIGSALYFLAYLDEGRRSFLSSPWESAVVLGIPWLLLSALARRFDRGRWRAVAVAFYVGGAVLLPPLLLIVLRENGWATAVPGTPAELFAVFSNRQLQLAAAVSTAWAAWLALRTATVALASLLVGLLFLFHLTLLGDWGLREWLDQGAWDRLGVALVPWSVATFGLGLVSERVGRASLASPLYVGGVAVLVAALELLALDGRAFAHLGVSLAPLRPEDVADPVLLDTVAALTLNGLLLYSTAGVLGRTGTPLMRFPSRLLYAVSPFAVLEPLAYLSQSGEYSRRFDWLYLGLAVATAFVSHIRQRRSFYYAGLGNTAVALLLITDHYGWLARSGWAAAVILAGATTVALGSLLHLAELRRRQG